VIVRIAWIGAILGGVVAVLVGLLSGADGGDSSGVSPQATSPPGFAFSAQAKAESGKTAAPRGDRSQRAKGHIHEESRLNSGTSSGSAGPPENASGSAPVVTSQPEPQPALKPRPTPPRQPRPTPAPPPIPVSSPPAPPAPVQAPATVANNNNDP
jgi:hypothetical protein